MTMTAGDPVWYRQVLRGGYGFGSDVPGVFKRASPRRVVIKVFLKSGATTQIAVHPKNVRPRDPEAVWK